MTGKNESTGISKSPRKGYQTGNDIHQILEKRRGRLLKTGFIVEKG